MFTHTVLNFKNLLRPLVFVVSIFVLFAAFQTTPFVSQEGPAKAQAYACILGPAGVADYGPLSNKAQWCDCAARNNDAGSLIREGCPQAPQSSVPPTSVNVPATGGGFNAPACNTLVTNRVCGGQPAYDRCTKGFDGNRAYYDCYASANSACQGRIYCPDEDNRPAAGNPAPVNAAPSCDGVRKTFTCSQATYEGCTKFYRGNEAYYRCVSPQNNQCQGEYRCSAEDLSGGAGSGAGNNQGQLVNNGSSSSGSSTSSSAAAGGAGGSVVVTVNSAGGQQAAQSQPRVITAGAGGQAKQLPKTGLPGIALAALGFIPLGLRLKRFNKGQEENISANYLWEERAFKSIS